MATSKEKLMTLEQWRFEFPNLSVWKDQFLIERRGPLVTGVCLDSTRDPQSYKPKFFYHNLTIASPVITLGYAAPLRHRGVARSVKYGVPVGDLAEAFKVQVESLRSKITFDVFVKHIVDTRNGVFGPSAAYLPHALRDISTVGSFLGDTNYFLATLDEAGSSIDAAKDINPNITGSVVDWEKDVLDCINAATEQTVRQNLNALQLPALSKLPMPYARVPHYWTLL
jgi:hypothetical protein